MKGYSENLMVSVMLLTFNHEKYIRECLDSILAQKVGFKYEVVVGDDASSDQTQQVLKEYEDKFPDVFKLILRGKNIGATHNLYDTLMHCKGKYIAGLEGDDYWLDENKLQLQFDFLEAHPEFIGCSHKVKMVDELGQHVPKGDKYFEGCHWGYYKELYTFEDYKRFEMPGQGSTWFYRNIYPEGKYDYSLIEKIHPLVGDRSVMLILASQGNWYYMQDKTMTCYRYVTDMGQNSWASWAEKNNRTLSNIELLTNLEKYAKKNFDRIIDFRKQKFVEFHAAVYWYYKERDAESRKRNKENLKKILKLIHPKSYFIFREIISQVQLKLYLSTVVNAIKSGSINTNNTVLCGGSWKKFNKARKNRTIVAFGDGVSYKEFLRKYGDRYEIPCVMDNDTKKEGQYRIVYKNVNSKWKDEYYFSLVVSPKEILNWEKDRFVVLITSPFYHEQMAKQLSDMGFENYFSLGIMESKKLRYKFLGKEK